MEYCKHCMMPVEQGGIYCPSCGQVLDSQELSHHLMPGTILSDRYVVGTALGEGGFGITYIGRDITLDMRVAVKEYYPNGIVVRNNAFSSEVSCVTGEEKKALFEKGRNSFLKEARILAKFSGEPGIVGVRDTFEQNGTAYIVMEFLDGITLKEYLKTNGILSVDQAIDMLTPVMLSLEKVHRQGMIHRDISPDNIMIVSDGVKLLDFGAARDYTGAENKSLSVILKPGFAPKEQYSNRGKQGPWTDIYSLCATMYICITGKLPPSSIDRITDDTLQPPSALGIPISETAEYAIMKGLSIEASDRYQMFSDLLADLENEWYDPESMSGDEEFYLNNGMAEEGEGYDPSGAAGMQNGNPPMQQDMDDQVTMISETAPPGMSGAFVNWEQNYTPPDDNREDPQKESPPQEKKKRPLMVAALCIAAVLLGAGVYFIVSHVGGSAQTALQYFEKKGFSQDTGYAETVRERLDADAGSLHAYRDVPESKVEEWVEAVYKEGYSLQSRFGKVGERCYVFDDPDEKKGIIAGFSAEGKNCFIVFEATGEDYDFFVGYDTDEMMRQWSNINNDQFFGYENDQIYGCLSTADGPTIVKIDAQTATATGVNGIAANGFAVIDGQVYYRAYKEEEKAVYRLPQERLFDNARYLQKFKSSLLYSEPSGVENRRVIRYDVADGSSHTVLEAAASYPYAAGHLLFYRDDADGEKEHVYNLLTGENRTLTIERTSDFVSDGKSGYYEDESMRVKQYDFQTGDVSVKNDKGCWGHLCLTPDGLYFQKDKNVIVVYRGYDTKTVCNTASYVFAIPSGVIIVDMDNSSNTVSNAYVCDASSDNLRKIEVQ